MMERNASSPLSGGAAPFEGELRVDEETGEAAGVAGVIGAALGALAGGPPGAALGAAGGMALGAAAELAVHGPRHHSRQPEQAQSTPVSSEHEHRWSGPFCQVCGVARPVAADAPREQSPDGSE